MSWPDIILSISCGLLACIGGWVAYQLFAQNGHVLLRLETLERRLDERPQPDEFARKHLGLPPRSVLNDFYLPVLSGGTMTLYEWRGSEVVLIFVSPHCSHSRKLLPQLTAICNTRTTHAPTPLIITTGDVQENRRWFAENGVESPVLVQEDTEVAFLHHAMVTPMAYLVDAEGCTVGPAAMSAPAILDLLNNGRNSSNGNTPAGVPQRAPGSRLAREGLSAGTPAPEFTLPGLDGTSISLSDYRGRMVLLVFSDPDCEPCQRIAPLLERAHRGSGQLAVVMISRGDPDANRAKVREHGLTFPVALQRKWEVSRAYSMFATPIAYLIDETGVLASGVAVGGGAILALAGKVEAGKVSPAR